MELDLVKTHDFRILMRNVESKIRIHCYHSQSALSLKNVAVTQPSAHVLAVYLAVCSTCSRIALQYSHHGMRVRYPPGASDPGLFFSAANFLNLYQLGTWRIQLSSFSILPHHPLRRHPFCVPDPSLLFFPFRTDNTKF